MTIQVFHRMVYVLCTCTRYVRHFVILPGPIDNFKVFIGVRAVCTGILFRFWLFACSSNHRLHVFDTLPDPQDPCQRKGHGSRPFHFILDMGTVAPCHRGTKASRQKNCGGDKIGPVISQASRVATTRIEQIILNLPETYFDAVDILYRASGFSQYPWINVCGLCGLCAPLRLFSEPELNRGVLPAAVRTQRPVYGTRQLECLALLLPSSNEVE